MLEDEPESSAKPWSLSSQRVFRFSHEAPQHLPYVAGIGLTAAALLAAWGTFIRLNRSAEELEPEAMEQAKREDKRVEQGPEA